MDRLTAGFLDHVTADRSSKMISGVNRAELCSWRFTVQTDKQAATKGVCREELAKHLQGENLDFVDAQESSLQAVIELSMY